MFSPIDFLFYPDKLSPDYQFNFDEIGRELLDYEEVMIEVEESIFLSALHFTHKDRNKSKGCILYFHGNAGSLADWGYIVGDFVAYPYDFFIVDYRGFGRSGGVIKNEAQFFADAQKCYDYIATKYNTKDIVLFGRSIGTGAASYLAAHNPAKLLLLETPFYSLLEIAKEKFPFLPVSILLKTIKMENHKYLSKVNYPIHIIHGTKDEVVPYASGKRLADEMPGKVRFYKIENGRHNNLSAFSEYHEILGEILKD